MTTSPARAVVITGGEIHTTPAIGPDDLVIAADSGYDHALALAVPVDLLVGDLDSISVAGLDHARSTAVEIEEYPANKDNTDLELALQAAIARRATSIDVYGGEGGRLGHLLSVALSTVHPSLAAADVTWHTRTGPVRAATPQHTVSFPAAIGELVTLLPVGTVEGVTITGLRWSLDNATLERGTSRGVSNETVSNEVSIEVDEGAVLVIQEGPISQ